MLSLFDQGPHAPCPRPFNLAAHVLARADDTPDKIALAIVDLGGAEEWTYRRLKQAVLGTAAGLKAQALTPGGFVLMRLGNDVEFPIAYLGAIAAGFVPVPTSSQLTEAEVSKIAADLSPVAVLRGAQVACPDLPGVAVIDDSALRKMWDLAPAAFDMGDPERIAYVVYTSGTSGNSRAVAHAHRAIWARQMMHQGWYGIGPDDRLMHAGAFNWTYTLGTGLMDPWSVGATALIPAEGVEPQSLALLMKRHEASIFAAAPGVYRKILNQSAGQLDLPRLRHGLTAGEKVSDAIRADWMAAAGTELYEAFGMSECSTFISASPSRPAAKGALGAPQIGRRVAILGPDGPVPIGEAGDIAVARTDPGLMLGYLGAEEETRARMRGEWFMTGDRGVMDENFQITYAGRADDMMNAGGYRVSPLEVEAALAGIDGISELAVTDVEVKADTKLIFCFYTGPKAIDEKHLSSIAEQRLARYKQPRGFVHIPEMPRNPNGKLKRRALAEMWRKPPQQ